MGTGISCCQPAVRCRSQPDVTSQRVDLGIANLAVTSTPDGKLNRLLSGRFVKAKRNQFFDRRYSIHCTKRPDPVRRERGKNIGGSRM